MSCSHHATEGDVTVQQCSSDAAGHACGLGSVVLWGMRVGQCSAVGHEGGAV